LVMRGYGLEEVGQKRVQKIVKKSGKSKKKF
jgi:hypothetical protein